MKLLHIRIARRTSAALCAAALLVSPFLASAAGQALPPVETGRANTAYLPMFSGQTRAPGIKT